MPEQYVCAMCGEIHDKITDGSWSDENAAEELHQKFGDVSLDDCDILCDDCYNRVINQ